MSTRLFDVFLVKSQHREIEEGYFALSHFRSLESRRALQTGAQPSRTGINLLKNGLIMISTDANNDVLNSAQGSVEFVQQLLLYAKVFIPLLPSTFLCRCDTNTG